MLFFSTRLEGNNGPRNALLVDDATLRGSNRFSDRMTSILQVRDVSWRRARDSRNACERGRGQLAKKKRKKARKGLPYMTSEQKGGGSRNTPNLRTNGIHIADKEGEKVKLEGNALITCGEGELEGGQFFSLHI